MFTAAAGRERRIGRRDERRRAGRGSGRSRPRAAAAGEPEELFEAAVRGSVDELLDAGAHTELDAMRHSAAHVMAEAVVGLFPDAQLGIGPSIDDGFYYDFLLPRPLTPDDLAAIEAGMRASIAADHPFVRKEVPFAEGRAFFEGSPPAVQGRDPRRPGGAGRARRATPLPPTSTYEHGPFIDLCKGPHVASTGKIGPFKLMTRGRRVLARLREAADAAAHLRHRLADPGRAGRLPAAARGGQEARPPPPRRAARPVQLPRRQPRLGLLAPQGPALCGGPSRPPCARSRSGAATRRSTRRMLVHKKLWEQSGHWANYQDNMFVLESEGQTFSLKPMNCPESTFIYKSRLRSYRDLPLRFSEFGRLHRNERSGTLSGLTRVRHFVQDDAHIYLRPDQLQDEIAALLGEVYEVYGWFGLEPHFTFGTRPDKALGDPALWEKAESPDQGRPRLAGQAVPPQAEGRRLLRAQDRHPDRGRPRPRVADGHDPGGPGHAARALRPAPTSTRTARPSGR